MRRQVWFDRDAGADEEFRFPGDQLKGERAMLARVTRPNALFLSTAAAHDHDQLSVLYRWFMGSLWLVTLGADRDQGGPPSTSSRSPSVRATGSG
jgi:hypothetical protein